MTSLSADALQTVSPTIPTAVELGVEAEVVEADLGRVLLACESRAEEVITAALEPARPEVTITAEGRVAALTLLRDPDLVGRSRRRSPAAAATNTARALAL